MNVNEAVRNARALLAVHGLHGWTIKLDRQVKRAGSCDYRTRTISLSRVLTELWPEHEVRDTVLHEIAHAIAGPAAGHGPDWRRVALAIGSNGQAKYKTTEDTPPVPFRYVGTCPNGHTSGRHKMSKAIKLGASCGRCAPNRFDARYRLVWVDSRGVRV